MTDDALLRSEEELRASVTTDDAGRLRVRKEVDVHHVDQLADRGIEHAELERLPAEATDSGHVETLPDGSVSIPVFEEQLVIEKRLVVRERVVIRKHTVVEQQRVEADLRRERVEIEADETVADRVHEMRQLDG